MENTELISLIEGLYKEINSLSQQISEQQEVNGVKPSRSSELKDLFAALAKAQAEIKIAGLNAENPYFKSSYADLAEIVRVSRPALTKNGLSVMQQILPNDDGQNILHTILGHQSGQWIESRMRILPSKPSIQDLGSYITYLKRYSYSAIIGVVATNEDDDGEAAVYDERETKAKGVALNRKYNPKEQTYETITKEQLEEIEYELSNYPDITEMVLDGLKIQSLADIPKSKFLVAVNRVRDIKRVREG